VNITFYRKCLKSTLPLVARSLILSLLSLGEGTGGHSALITSLGSRGGATWIPTPIALRSSPSTMSQAEPGVRRCSLSFRPKRQRASSDPGVFADFAARRLARICPGQCFAGGLTNADASFLCDSVIRDFPPVFDGARDACFTPRCFSPRSPPRDGPIRARMKRRSWC
jgi:hypothetical protein